MKNKGRINHSVQEGIFFFLVGAALLGYAVTAYGKAFNKDWGQSPYLFPLMVAVAFMVLAVCLIKEGVTEWKKTGETKNLTGRGIKESLAADDSKKVEKAVRRAENWTGVAVVLVLCALYYAALVYAKIPYITVGIFTFFFTFSTFEVATLIFLAVMMAYMGVRKPLILALVPLGATLFLSIAFRTMLNVLLP